MMAAPDPHAGDAPPRSWTKVVATLGPATDDHIGELVQAGLGVARINFSHGSEADHRARIERVRA